MVSSPWRQDPNDSCAVPDKHIPSEIECLAASLKEKIPTNEMNALANWSQRTEMFLKVFEFILGRKEARLIFGDREAIIGVVWVIQINLSRKKHISRWVLTCEKRDVCFLTRSMSMGRASCWRTNVRLSMKPSPLIWLSSTFSEKRDHLFCCSKWTYRHMSTFHIELNEFL